ncbi:uncharacterized protein PHALS_07884 [Plasmopara halstedii]|uniref:Uncharacterized protein n=1 Tax=Plasmopara halstedii TaxID=4781 RepID=A0A0P1B8B4_PLAHL|nr:uncharacterized protein PHALS_07884 [Plasmopara halstedii]CEG50159.1 hypothetical protein PHALS_07884 [Plasmopara halstedii]|eukprot:XP_024586528.1 hypothetical protein PHALS_07884 [Plasmopara halstedii]
MRSSKWPGTPASGNMVTDQVSASRNVQTPTQFVRRRGGKCDLHTESKSHESDSRNVGRRARCMLMLEASHRVKGAKRNSGDSCPTWSINHMKLMKAAFRRSLLY